MNLRGSQGENMGRVGARKEKEKIIIIIEREH